jgi:hypothetical protein
MTMVHAIVVLMLTLMQGVSPAGKYELTFQPRSEVMSATLVIAARDSGYTASLTMRQLHGTVKSDSVSLLPDGRVRVFVPNDVADMTFQFRLAGHGDDTFLVHLLDGDLTGPVAVKRVPNGK